MADEEANGPTTPLKTPETDTLINQDGDGGDETFDDRCGPQLKRLNRSTWFLLMAELCERFSYYGIKAGLVLYLTQSLKMTDMRGKAWYHVFSSLSYFTGVVGAIMADSWLGKFRTILYSFILYSLFEILLTVLSVPTVNNGNSAGPLLSLILIAVVCGNIKPCLGAFGGDQVNKKDVKLVGTFFSMFYMSVNVGATCAMIFAPMLRTDIQCYGSDCYTAIFGVMAAIMTLAGVSFMLGTNGYVKRTPEGNMLVRVSRIIWCALRERRKTGSKENVKSHWLYYADGMYSRTEIDDVRSLLKVMLLYIPLPFYWALFGQQGSSWTLQAEQMDGEMGSTELRSDQIQFFNPVLVLILIPLFNLLVYPLVEKMGVRLTPLRKMVSGMFLTALAFAITAFIQIKIENIPSNPISPGSSSIHIINASPCERVQIDTSEYTFSLKYGERSGNVKITRAAVVLNVTGSNCYSKSDIHTSTLKVIVQNNTIQSVILDINEGNRFTATVLKQELPIVDLKTADTRVRTIYVPGGNLSDDIRLTYKHPLYSQRDVVMTNVTSYDGSVRFILASKYNIDVREKNGAKIPVKNSHMKLLTFGAYTVLLTRPMSQRDTKELTAHVYEEVEGTSVHRFWQLPQYIVVTAGEILFSVTGLEFAYSQAPQSMKSVLQSFWMVTVALGDIVVVIISLINPVNGVVAEMFLYGGIMLVVMVVFGIMAHFYTYNDFSGAATVVMVEEGDEQKREESDAL